MHHKLHKVVDFELLQAYKIRIKFDDDFARVIDFSPLLYGEMWGPLRDLSLFNQVTVDPIAHTLTWPNQADFDPETL